MQISRSQPSIAAPLNSAAAPTRTEKDRPQTAAAAARPATPAPSQEQQSGQTVRERLGNLAEAFGARIEHLANKDGISAEQASALDAAHQAFMQDLRDLAASQMKDGEPGSGLGKGLAAIKDTLRSSVQDALRPVEADATGAAAPGASPAERIAAVQNKLATRLQGVLANSDLSPRAAGALEQMAAGFSANFERLAMAVDGGGLKAPGRLGEAFAEMMNSLTQGVHSVLGAVEPAPSALYSPAGPLAGERMAPPKLEQLA